MFCHAAAAPAWLQDFVLCNRLLERILTARLACPREGDMLAVFDTLETEGSLGSVWNSLLSLDQGGEAALVPVATFGHADDSRSECEMRTWEM